MRFIDLIPVGMRQLVFLHFAQGRGCVVNRLALVVMVTVGCQFLKPREDCDLKLLDFPKQLLAVKFDDCFLKLSLPLWVFQFSIAQSAPPSSGTSTLCGKTFCTNFVPPQTVSFRTVAPYGLAPYPSTLSLCAAGLFVALRDNNNPREVVKESGEP